MVSEVSVDSTECCVCCCCYCDKCFLPLPDAAHERCFSRIVGERTTSHAQHGNHRHWECCVCCTSPLAARGLPRPVRARLRCVQRGLLGTGPRPRYVPQRPQLEPARAHSRDDLHHCICFSATYPGLVSHNLSPQDVHSEVHFNLLMSNGQLCVTIYLIL